jgi:predicted NUDIX family NTP pyrophosphohydrolase
MKRSAGILLFRRSGAALEFFLVHPGGPFWKKKDEGAWSIPKGEYNDDEDPLQAARREFKEETGYDVDGQFIPLKDVKLKSGKLITAWALEKDIDATGVRSNTFSIEWPPRSGRMQDFPEIDRADWFETTDALLRINEAQSSFIKELAAME